MGFLDRFRRKPEENEERAVTDSAAIPKNSEQYGVYSGVNVTDRSAMHLTSVFACARVISDSISTLPLDAYRKNGPARVELDPTPQLIRAPFGRDLLPFEGLDQIVRCMVLRGEALLIITDRDSLERPTELTPLHPDDWSVSRRKDSGERIYSVGGSEVSRANVVHIKRFSMPGELHGISPIKEAANTIGLGLAAERYGARWFAQSADPSAVLESDENMTDEQVALTQRQWIDSQGGKRYPAVTTGGLKYRRISITPEESQFLETRKFSRGEIAMLFGVPPHMIGDTEKSTSWGTGIEQQSIGYVRYTLRPYLTAIEQHFTNLLPRGQFARFNIDALLRADTKARYDAYVSARSAGWMNVNEIRALEDMPPVPGGDQYIQPLNMGPLGSDPLAERPDAAPESQGDDDDEQA